MSEYFNDGDYEYSNPYAIAPAQNVSMNEESRHDSGNALAANAEARAIAEVKAQVLMARQFPRDTAFAMDRILNECKRPTLAEAAVYAFPRGKEVVTGPSIRLAEVLARNWGNNTFGYEVLDRKPSIGKRAGSSAIRVYAWDLETNTYISRQFEVKHWRQTRSGGYPITEDRDIYELEANMAARRMRACILQMIPGDVTTAAVNACKKTDSSELASAMKDDAQRSRIIQKTVKSFTNRYGVTEDDLVSYLDAKVEDWTADHMLKLKEIDLTVKDGTALISDYFERLAANEKDTLVSKEQTQKLMEAARATGKQGQISDEMKKLGIAKFADTPAERYDEIMNLIHSFDQAKEETVEEAVDRLV